MSEMARERLADQERCLDALGNGPVTLRYKKGQAVFSKGDPADAVFYIKKGRIGLRVASEQGKEATIGLEATEAFLGDECITGQARRSSSAVAMTDCEVLRVEKATMARALYHDPNFAEVFIAHLFSRIKWLEEKLIDQLFNSSEKRLVRTLLQLADFGKEGENEAVIGKVSQSTLAEMIGTTRSRVNVLMNKFRNLGLIEYNGQLKVHASLSNVILDEHPAPKLDD
jgi:CRP/FNR family cyclic AMP-dependent transcriptional regulator